MWDVECGMWDVECGVAIRHANILPQMPQIDAHRWVFSRIIYSCSAACCLVFDAPPAQRIATDFFACGECDEVGCHMTGLLDMRKIRLRSVGPKGHQSPRHRRKE